MDIGPVELDLQYNSEGEVRDALDEIVDFSQRRADREFSNLEFKSQLHHPTKLRKTFSCFANADGGLIIVGGRVEDDGTINWVGIDQGEHPSEERVEDLLSAPAKISEPPSFEPLRLQYNGVTVALYQIYPSPNPIEMRKDGEWVTYRRANESCRQLSQLEIQLEMAGNEDWARDGTINDTSSLQYHRIDGSSQEFIELEIENIGEHQRWFDISSTGRPIFVPVPVMPFHPDTTVYTTQTRQSFSEAKLPDVLVELEEKILQQHGLEHEVWSIGQEISFEAGMYKVGAGARNLVKQLEGNGDDDEGLDFAWILFTGDVVYKIVGRFTNNKWYLTIRRYISFIPNHFLFVTVNENARVRSVPLSVNQDDVSHGEKWVSPKTVLGEDPPAAELRELPGAEIHGYLGTVPRERSYNTPFRQRTGSVVISKNDSQKALGGKEFPEFILDSDPLIGSIDRAPFGLNDKENVKISSLIVSGRTESFSPGGSTVVMFNISTAFHQLDAYRFSQPE